ncbi:hypothetical protein FNB79_08635 [Formosa sediminum]|uniref:Alpha/beta hydrolase n=1 Tax=Formosa sediminum TaxID=2594004 RepID=A0A516GR89_9FLAO|nr:DUF6051 family protein [Formosa sediminum]QDO94041.1 hypothetical protein FNB79_08635 [Formosa sediminum]
MNTELLEFPFESISYNILPGTTDYECIKHALKLKSSAQFRTEVGTINDNVHIKDIRVNENHFFNYQIIKPKSSTVSKKVIFLLHGFNERDWSKYLPWAKAICNGTGSSVVLFPLAFHMQRAPKQWSEKREMYKLSEQRKKRYPNIINSTLSNVAISMRLHAMPQRFIYSGLQTYYDIIQLIENFKSGKNPQISTDFQFDFFAYSIGGFLAQILKLTNYNNYFSNAKLCLFCSGTTFNRFSSVSKFILDSEANVALYSFLIEHFDKFLKKDNLLKHYILDDHLEGEVFHAMLDYQKKRDFREALLKKYEDQIYAITLKKDYVIPSFEIINTLKGAYRDINIKVDEIDFDRDYTHENPFPNTKINNEQISKDFNFVFKKVCDFYNT